MLITNLLCLSKIYLQNSLHEVQEHLSDGKNAVNSSNAGSAQHGTSSHVDGVFELEQLLKQKTFTR